MPHPEHEHELQIALATALRERDEAESALTTSNVLNGQRCQRISELENETERVGAALRAYIEGHELALTRAEAAESALAAARRECEGLRKLVREACAAPAAAAGEEGK